MILPSCMPPMWRPEKASERKGARLNLRKTSWRNLRDIMDDLTAGTYRPGEFERFKIFEPKERDIEAPAFKDKVVLHAVTDNGLYDAITRSFVRNNCANQTGKGTADAVIRLKTCMVRYYAQYGTAEGWITQVRYSSLLCQHQPRCAQRQAAQGFREARPGYAHL